ncbi:Pachytene checkpoint protein 2-like protein [Hibiscus syriacus]|uniref:Pachytene checkpoint protein 2 homolog n=1 Tax=Hibiscus syriacus TaxID=106335 RepID=A0A6A2YVP2_HIBSY|nr:Pachytene checkpoint protein 2-like protein [Hibiscus syriacus]
MKVEPGFISCIFKVPHRLILVVHLSAICIFTCSYLLLDNTTFIILLHGPPGTGKTSLCKALAQILSIRFSSRYPQCQLIEVNAHSLFSKWFSESGKLVAKLFQKIQEMVEEEHNLIYAAAAAADEVESLAAARNATLSGSEPSDSIRVVNALLTQMDNLKLAPNVIIMTTSNIIAAIAIQALASFRKLYPEHITEEIQNCIGRAAGFIEKMQAEDGTCTDSSRLLQELLAMLVISLTCSYEEVDQKAKALRAAASFAPSEDASAIDLVAFTDMDYEEAWMTEVIWSDNSSAIGLSANPVYHSKTKHEELDVHFVREKVVANMMKINFVPSTHQVEDRLTDALITDYFRMFREKLGVVSLEEAERMLSIVQNLDLSAQHAIYSVKSV